MASNTRLLLRYKPTTHPKVLSAQSSTNVYINDLYGITNQISARQFSIASRFWKQGRKTKAIHRHVQPQSPRPHARNFPTPPPAAGPAPPLASSHTTPPPPPPPLTLALAPTPKLRPSTSDWMSNLFSRHSHVLLYAAPNHRAFFLSSYAVGFFFLIGGYSYAEMFLRDPPEGSTRPKAPFFLKMIGGFSTLAVVAFGTAFILGPMKVVKSITAVRQPVTKTSSGLIPWKLSVEIKKVLPFTKAKVFEALPNTLVLDRNLPTALQDINFISVSIKKAEDFTAKCRSGVVERKERNTLARFNESLINTWPSMKREVKRMFLRDQMAYLRVPGSGNFKLDLQGCHILDGGNVLNRLTSIDTDAKPGSTWRRTLVGLLGSKNVR